MIGLVFLLYATFGFTFTLGKIILRYAAPIFIVASRMVIAGCALALYSHFRYRPNYRAMLKDWFLYAQYIFFGVVFFYCARSWSLQYLSTTKTALIFTLLPFFTAFFSYLMHREKLSLQKAFGLALGFFGMMPVLVTHSTAENDFFSLGVFSLSEMLAIASVASISYSMLIMRKIVRHHNTPPALANGLSMLGGGVISLMLSELYEPVWIKHSPQFFAAISGIQIILSNIVCQNLQAYLLRFHSPTFMSFASLISPLCAAFYGWLLLGEHITWHYVLSFALVFTGLILYYLDEIRAGEVY